MIKAKLASQSSLKGEDSSEIIPVPERDGSLMSRLFPIVLIGADAVLDKKSAQYLRLVVRLSDKAFDEYEIIREYLLEEIKHKDKLRRRFAIINHLENAIGALSRAMELSDTFINGYPERMGCKKCGTGAVSARATDANIALLLRGSNRRGVTGQIKKLRNRVEHMNQDIFSGEHSGNLSLDVSDDYKNVEIGGVSLPINDLALLIEEQHKFVLKILSILPDLVKGGLYMHTEKKVSFPMTRRQK